MITRGRSQCEYGKSYLRRKLDTRIHNKNAAIRKQEIRSQYYLTTTKYILHHNYYTIIISPQRCIQIQIGEQQFKPLARHDKKIRRLRELRDQESTPFRVRRRGHNFQIQHMQLKIRNIFQIIQITTNVAPNRAKYFCLIRNRIRLFFFSILKFHTN